MRKLRELENKWLNYKVKRVLLPLVKVSAVYLLGVTAYYAYDKQDTLFASATPTMHNTKVLGVSMENNSTAKAMQREASSEVIEPVKAMLKKEEVSKEELKSLEKVTLTPVIPVIDMQKEERIKVVKKRASSHKKSSSKKRVASSKRASHLVKAKPNSYLTPKELGKMKQATPSKVNRNTPKEVHKTKKMHFTSTSVNYGEKIKSKFANSNNARDALLLAKLYYKKQNFKEAEMWALRANKLNTKLEESWFMFAKSKVKLGKKQEALKILVTYYKKNHSSKAKHLIQAIKGGKL